MKKKQSLIPEPRQFMKTMLNSPWSSAKEEASACSSRLIRMGKAFILFIKPRVYLKRLSEASYAAFIVIKFGHFLRTKVRFKEDITGILKGNEEGESRRRNFSNSDRVL